MLFNTTKQNSVRIVGMMLFNTTKQNSVRIVGMMLLQLPINSHVLLLPLLLVHCQDGVTCAKTFAHSFTVFESVIYSLFITDLLCV